MILTTHPISGLGTVYTETVIHSAPPALAAEAPYQIAIVELTGPARVTGRIDGERVAVGDTVEFLEFREGVAHFRKT